MKVCRRVLRITSFVALRWPFWRYFSSWLCSFAVVSTVLWIALPITFSLVCVYGGMGWSGVHLDIGTSMLASLALGVGVDYAVHAFMSDDGISRGTAGAIVTNALGRGSRLFGSHPGGLATDQGYGCIDSDSYGSCCNDHPHGLHSLRA